MCQELLDVIEDKIKNLNGSGCKVLNKVKLKFFFGLKWKKRNLTDVITWDSRVSFCFWGEL